MEFVYFNNSEYSSSNRKHGLLAHVFLKHEKVKEVSLEISFRLCPKSNMWKFFRLSANVLFIEKVAELVSGISDIMLCTDPLSAAGATKWKRNYLYLDLNVLHQLLDLTV